MPNLSSTGVIVGSGDFKADGLWTGLGRYGKGRFGGVPQMMIRLNAPTTGKGEPEEVYFEHVLQEAYCVVPDLLGVLDRRRGREPREYAWHTANEQEL
ncbi:hypothetical protein RFM98_20775 [Mesorhizobium sp. VK9D]|uniref:hypothetical protein n=1 Tax=Mesorhizobium australafricanum TaxID=3072311 RepID=UPI002A2489D1|nr:hypothetical protein [Mesorhizobium sp. VK9D]MDX8455190.1 hypothetical protein [Mesorhizobium sp. VK9D]